MRCCLCWKLICATQRQTTKVIADRSLLAVANASFLQSVGTFSNDCVVLDWTRATLQLAGKESTRSKCFVSVQGTRLLVGDKHGDLDGDKAFAVDLTGAEMRKAAPQVQLVLQHCLEISHPHRKLVMPSADYIFISFGSSRMLNDWVDVSCHTCVCVCVSACLNA